MNATTENFMVKNKSSLDVLVANMRALMKINGMTGPALASKSKVSIRMVNLILKKDRTPTLRIVDQIAGAFSLCGWQMIVPEIPRKSDEAKLLAETVSNYLQTSDEGRQYIAHVAQKEAGYNAT